MVIGKTVIVDGKKFISEDALIEAMVKACIEYTTVDDISVDEYESTRVSCYQSMIRNMTEMSSTMNKFRELYVRERFIKRTIGV